MTKLLKNKGYIGVDKGKRCMCLKKKTLKPSPDSKTLFVVIRAFVLVLNSTSMTDWLLELRRFTSLTRRITLDMSVLQPTFGLDSVS